MYSSQVHTTPRESPYSRVYLLLMSVELWNHKIPVMYRNLSLYERRIKVEISNSRHTGTCWISMTAQTIGFTLLLWRVTPNNRSPNLDFNFDQLVQVRRLGFKTDPDQTKLLQKNDMKLLTKTPPYRVSGCLDWISKWLTFLPLESRSMVRRDSESKHRQFPPVTSEGTWYKILMSSTAYVPRLKSRVVYHSRLIWSVSVIVIITDIVDVVLSVEGK